MLFITFLQNIRHMAESPTQHGAAAGFVETLAARGESVLHTRGNFCKSLAMD